MIELSKSDLQTIHFIKQRLHESSLVGRWGWNVHAYKEHYRGDVSSLLQIISKLTNKEE